MAWVEEHGDNSRGLMSTCLGIWLHGVWGCVARLLIHMHGCNGPKWHNFKLVDLRCDNDDVPCDA